MNEFSVGDKVKTLEECLFLDTDELNRVGTIMDVDNHYGHPRYWVEFDGSSDEDPDYGCFEEWFLEKVQ